MEYAFTKTFDDLNIDFYYNGEKNYIKRTDLGKALNYACPTRSASKLHSLHKDVIERYSVKAAIPDKRSITGCLEFVMYDKVAITIYCYISKQPIADRFCEWAIQFM